MVNIELFVRGMELCDYTSNQPLLLLLWLFVVRSFSRGSGSRIKSRFAVELLLQSRVVG